MARLLICASAVSQPSACRSSKKLCGEFNIDFFVTIPHRKNIAHASSQYQPALYGRWQYTVHGSPAVVSSKSPPAPASPVPPRSPGHASEAFPISPVSFLRGGYRIDLPHSIIRGTAVLALFETRWFLRLYYRNRRSGSAHRFEDVSARCDQRRITTACQSNRGPSRGRGKGRYRIIPPQLQVLIARW